MTKISGMALNISKSSDGTNGAQWQLFFTEGLFEAPGVLKNTEPSLLRLKKSDYQCTVPCGYHLYYNPYTNKYNLIDNDTYLINKDCNDYGYLIGGFVVAGCKLTFVYPRDCEDTEYIRPFSDEFDTAFNKKVSNCDEHLDICGAFDELQFSDAYDISCPIIEDGNAFSQYEFDNEEFETDPEKGPGA